jgi:hypothetical protein
MPGGWLRCARNPASLVGAATGDGCAVRGVVDATEVEEMKPDMLAFYALRYVQGRRTYAVSDVCQAVRALWPTLDGCSRDAIRRLLSEPQGGAACDEAVWTGLREWIDGQEVNS